MTHSITISYEDVPSLEASSENLIQDVIEATLLAEGFDDVAEVSVKLVNQTEIKRLNYLYRNKNMSTDVLSFTQYTDDGFEAYEDEPVFIGDIVLCYDKAIQQATQLGHSVAREISYLVCHSCLHLLGYDHIELKDKAEMRTREKAIMSLLGIERV